MANRKTSSRVGEQQLMLFPDARTAFDIAESDKIKTHNRSLRRHRRDHPWYVTTLAEQGGVCKVCHKPPDKGWLVVDHDHRHCSRCMDTAASCGLSIDGLLHDWCNRVVGMAEAGGDAWRDVCKVDRVLARAVLDYLKRPDVREATRKRVTKHATSGGLWGQVEPPV